MAGRGKAIQLDHMYVCDLETCDGDDLYSAGVYNQRVWLCGIQNLATGHIQTWDRLDGLMYTILMRGDNQHIDIAVHNLKFDGSFIVPWLFDHGYTISEGKPKKGEFSVLIDERNAWYSVTIQVTTRKRVHIWDTLKLFPKKLEYLHTIYGTPTHKLIEDSTFYNKKRPIGHQTTAEEKAYFENDLIVLRETLLKHIQEYGLRYRKTQAGQAFYNFTQTFDTWRWRFPPLSLEDDAAIRHAYWGGISYVPKAVRGMDIEEEIRVYDINSSYPHKMGYKRMPYGPIRKVYEGKHPDMSKFWIASAYVRFTLKKDHIPCIPTKGISEGKPITQEKWLDDSAGVVRLTFCCIDYKLMLQSYDLEVISWEWSRHWAWKIHPELKSFVENNNTLKVHYKKEAKTATDPDQRSMMLAKSNRAKIDNNASYGKWGEAIIKRGKTPHMVDDDIVFLVDREDISKEYGRKFLPVAIAITAYGREQLLQVANALGAYDLYQDTDSVHYRASGQHIIDQLIEKKEMLVDDTDLGAWKFEGSYVWGRYLRPKCYMEISKEGEVEVTMAGLPADAHSGENSKQRSCVTKDNFHIGTNIPGGNGKLRTIRTRTGNKLVETDFTISEYYKFF